MNIKQAKEEIKNTIEAYLMKDEYGAYAIPAIRQRPVLLIGPPGVGKTQIMEQIARENGIGLVSYTITHHTRQSAVGLPFISQKSYGGQEYSVTEYTMSEIVASVYERMEETGLKEGILFIDEINCVSETLAPTMLQFLQCKTFGNHKIPEGWIIAAAGNPPEFNKSVREFDVVTLDRIKLIHVEPEFEVWKEYAYTENIHPAVISYLDIKRQNFCQIETTVDGKLFATPRGWEDLARLTEVYETLGKRVDRDVIGQYIQHGRIAKDFANYLELYYKYRNDYRVGEILAGKIREDLCNRLSRAPFDERLSVVSLLLSGLSVQIRKALFQEDLAEILVEQLKSIHKNFDKDQDVFQVFDSMTEQLREEVARKTEGLQLTRSQNRLYQEVLKRMDSYSLVLKGEGLNDSVAAWGRLRQLFTGEDEEYEKEMDSSGVMIEYAFDFMEAAFGSGQEMVIFVTELNASSSCVRFLQEYDCDRYFQYNRSLLFEDQEDSIKSKINEIEQR